MRRNLYRRLIFVLLVPMIFLLTGCDDFEKTFRFDWNEYQSASSAIETDDGSFVIVGSASNYGSPVSVFLKLDAGGEKLVEITGSYGDYESIKSANGGGYVIAGKTGSGDNTDGLILKTDENGNQEWAVSYGQELNDVEVLDDGYLVVGGSSPVEGVSAGGRFCIAKLTFSGQIVWEATDLENSAGTDAAVSADGTIMAVTQRASIVETDPNGVIVGSESHAVENIHERTFTSIAATSDGGFILGGQRVHYLPQQVRVAWIIRLSADREIIWQKTYAGPDFTTCGMEGLNSIIQTANGNFVFCGFQSIRGVSINGGSLYGWAMEIDQNGTGVWTKTRGGDSGYDDVLKSIIQTSDGRFLAVGSTTSFAQDATMDLWVVKFGEDSI